LGQLPNPGGILQQHPGHIHRMGKVLEAMDEVEADEQKQAESKSKLSDGNKR